MPNRYEVEIERHVRDAWVNKYRTHTVDELLSMVVDAVSSLGTGFYDQKRDAASLFILRNLFWFMPVGVDVDEFKQVALDRLNEELLTVMK